MAHPATLPNLTDPPIPRYTSTPPPAYMPPTHLPSPQPPRYTQPSQPLHPDNRPPAARPRAPSSTTNPPRYYHQNHPPHQRTVSQPPPRYTARPPVPTTNSHQRPLLRPDFSASQRSDAQFPPPSTPPHSTHRARSASDTTPPHSRTRSASNPHTSLSIDTDLANHRPPPHSALRNEYPLSIPPKNTYAQLASEDELLLAESGKRDWYGGGGGVYMGRGWGYGSGRSWSGRQWVAALVVVGVLVAVGVVVGLMRGRSGA